VTITEAARERSASARHPSDSSGWRLNVLGPVELCYDGVPVDVTGVARTLLVLLARNAGQEVTTTSLIAAVWGSAPPEDPGNVIASQISRLRKALTAVAPAVNPTQVIVTVPSGYILDVTAPNVDVVAFERLVGDGRRALEVGQPALARQRLDEALALWRGGAYEDVLDVARAEAGRLEDLRLAAVEHRIEARLALSAPAVDEELVSELERLAELHWHRERLWAQLMIALFRLGRRGDALAAHRRAQVLLADGLHAEPGPELRSAERAVLTNDESLYGTLPNASTVPDELAGPAPECLGRDEELAWLESALDLAATRRAQPRLIVGSPGMGKTRMLAELAHRAASRGIVVRYYRAHAGSLIADPDRLSLLLIDDADLASPADRETITTFVRSTLKHPVVTILTCRDPVRVGDLAGLPKLVMSGLDDASVAGIVRIYAPAVADATAVAAMVNAGGVPARIHRAASEWAFGRAGRRIDRAVESAAEPTRWLGSIRDEVVAGVQELTHVRAQARRLRPDGRRVVDPYRGIGPLQADDAELLHGRERATAELIAQLVEAPLLAVVGEPGVGKSSLVRAGLLPAVAVGVLPGSAQWRQIVVTPATVGSLTAVLAAPPPEPPEPPASDPPAPEPPASDPPALEPTAISPADAPVADLAPVAGADPSTVDAVGPGPGAAARADEPATTLLVVDQFEETFTVLGDDARARFLAELRDALAGPTRVVLTLRSPAYGALADHPDLAALVTANTFLLAPMSPDDLRRAVEQPALAAHVFVEDGLVETVVADARTRPADLVPLAGALRLLQTGGMTLTAYRQIGGLAGALETIGERALAAVDDRSAAERLLGRLATGGPRTQVRADETGAAHALAAHGVLTGYDDGTVGLARDSFLSNWPRLRRLAEEARSERDLRDHLSRAASAWSTGQAEVYRGARLIAALDFGADHAKELTQVEHDFLAAGRRHLLAEENRRRRKVALLHRWILALVLALVAALAIAALAVVRQTRTAADGARADAQRVGALAAAEPDLRLAMLLAVAANRLDPTVTEPLATTLGRAPDLMAVAGGGVTAVAPSPDGTTVAVGSGDGTIRLLDAATLRDRGTGWAYPDGGPVGGLAFTPDGRRLIGWGGDGDEAGIVVWDVAAGRMEGAPFGQAAPSGGGLLADGVTLLLGQAGKAVAWSIEARTPSTAYELPVDRVDALAVSPDGRLVAFGTDDGTTIFEPRTGDSGRLRDARRPSSISPDGRTLLTTSGEVIEVWGIGSRERRGEARHHTGDVVATAWSPDGSVFASAGADGLVVVWDVADPRPRAKHVFTGHAGPARSVAFAADGRSVVSVGRDGAALLWDLSGTRGLGPRAEAGDRRALACAMAGRDMTPDEWRRVLPDRPYQHVCPM
jgi:DNA-binding SARP family transcriptional activator